jgi:hypothetical protein
MSDSFERRADLGRGRGGRSKIAALLLASSLAVLVAFLILSTSASAISFTIRVSVRVGRSGPFEPFLSVPVNTTVTVRAVVTPTPTHGFLIRILRQVKGGQVEAAKVCIGHLVIPADKPVCSKVGSRSKPVTITYTAIYQTYSGRTTIATSAPATVTWVAPVAPSPYYVFVLTNVASPGNIFVGTLTAVQGKLTCDFTDGGQCADAGGADVPVTYTENLGPYATCAEATDAYDAAATNPHPAFGGEKVFIFGNSYFIDNKGMWCSP